MRPKTITKKTYTDLMRLSGYQERFEYLKLNGVVSELTFGGHRQINQMLYQSSKWMRVRRSIIIRDNGWDLGDPEYPIGSKIYVHHIEPITIEDVMNNSSFIYDEENLISVSFETHNALHYGGESRRDSIVLRKPYDTCPWRWKR